MKKYIMLLVSAVIMAFASCSDSHEIDIIETGDVTFDINTQSMYDEFDITNGIKRQILMDKLFAIAVKSLIYDQNGCLADSMTTYVYNTNSTQHSYTMLPNGKYTAVFIETVVYVDNDFQPFDYRIEGVDKLSTLQIEQISTPYWWAAVGVETREFTVNEKQIQITPKALGSIINCRFFDFTDSPCLKVGLGTKENYIGYKLDPSISEESRYMSELSETEYFALLGYAEVEDDEATFDIYVLGKTLTYTFYYQTEKNANTNYWSHLQKESKVTLKIGEKTYLAHAYDSNNGNVYDYYGTYSGMVSWYEALISGKDDDDDNGEPTPTGLVPEVNMKWGSTVSSVQSSMSGYTMSIGNSGSAILQNDGSYAIAYAGKNKEAMIAYFFTGERTGLFEADVIYPKSNVSQEELINYLESNYMFLASQDGMYMYCSSDFKTVGIVYENGDNWILGFIDAEQLGSMNSKVKLPAYRLPERSTTHTGVTTIDEGTKVSFSKVQECANDAVKNINTRIK